MTNPRFAEFEKLLDPPPCAMAYSPSDQPNAACRAVVECARSSMWPDRGTVDNHRAYCQDLAAAERPDDPAVYVVCEMREVGDE